MTNPALLVALDHALSSATDALNGARAILSAMAEGEDVVAPTDLPVPTDDPSTCGHPETFSLPGQTMCRSCGASETEDGTWRLL